MPDVNLSLIICTKDRPIDLEKVLTSIQAQTRKPFELLIIDGSDNSVESVAKKFESALPIKYFTVRPPGLTKQRNFGISHVSPESQWIGFLDDDLVLDSDCLENLSQFLEKSPELSGVGLRIYEQPEPVRSLIRELMLLDKHPGGKLTRAGSPATIRSFNEDTKVEWLYGGATFWRRDILMQYKFDEWFSGIGYFEDVDFSYRVSAAHQLAICSQARCHHYHHEIPVEKMARLGEWLVVAWWYFARVKNKFLWPAAIWGLFWMTFNNLAVSLLKNDPRRREAFKGNLKGWMKVINQQVVDAKGFQK